MGWDKVTRSDVPSFIRGALVPSPGATLYISTLYAAYRREFPRALLMNARTFGNVARGEIARMLEVPPKSIKGRIADFRIREELGGKPNQFTPRKLA